MPIQEQAMKTDIAARNQEIVELYRAGTTSRALSTRFGISYSRVRIIIREIQEADDRRKKSLEMVQRLKASNDFNTQWNATDLIEMLLLHKRFRNALFAYIRNHNITTLSLDDMLELISPKKRPLREFEYAPLTSINSIGKYGLRDYIKALSDLDLGEVFRKELQERVGMLR